MITDVCRLNDNANDPNVALDQVERCAAYVGLEKKQSLQLRLLAEEALGMARGMLGSFEAEFWIEANGKDFKIYLDMNADIDAEKREDLIGISTGRENEATKGVMGKLRRMIEFALYGDNDTTAKYITSSIFAPESIMGSSSDIGALYTWSLVDYMNQVKLEKEVNIEKWDELEKSTVAKLADDVKVSVYVHRVKMVISKSFK
ncbi:MAG: hypothetical protein Q4D04_02150 [Clostridia bacterium]|nr:hypothetical protein [Clostridia bacterium]